MNILVNRDVLSSDRTIGKMYVDECFQCYTMEDAVRKLGPRGEGKVWGQTAIPAGTYDLMYSFSPHFNRMMPHLEGVPFFDKIMIHWGNGPQDTDGCILVGHSRDAKMVYGSRVCFDALDARWQAYIASGGSIKVTVQ